MGTMKGPIEVRLVMRVGKLHYGVDTAKLFTELGYKLNIIDGEELGTVEVWQDIGYGMTLEYSYSYDVTNQKDLDNVLAVALQGVL